MQPAPQPGARRSPTAAPRRPRRRSPTRTPTAAPERPSAAAEATRTAPRPIFGVACGHPDGNDVEHLVDDPIHKLLLGRDPVNGDPLTSQPTLSRFEKLRHALPRCIGGGRAGW